MRTTPLKATVAAVVAVMLWAFVGVERIVGDHEAGISWETFIKHRPTLQVIFQNPAQKDLDIASFDTLSLAEQAAFIDYCTIRFGTPDAGQCRAIVIGRIV